MPVLQPAHLLAEGTGLGEGSSAAARLKRVFAGELALPVTHRAPQSSKPSSQTRFKCNSTLKKCPRSPGTSKPVGEVVSVPAGTSQPGLSVVSLSPIIGSGTGRNVDASTRGETSSLSVSPTPRSLAGKEAAEETDTGDRRGGKWSCFGRKGHFLSRMTL